MPPRALFFVTHEILTRCVLSSCCKVCSPSAPNIVDSEDRVLWRRSQWTETASEKMQLDGSRSARSHTPGCGTLYKLPSHRRVRWFHWTIGDFHFDVTKPFYIKITFTYKENPFQNWQARSKSVLLGRWTPSSPTSYRLTSFFPPTPSLFG